MAHTPRHTHFIPWVAAGLLLLAGCGAPQQEAAEEAPYTADWTSLAEHNEAPEWFQDAKLGIYFHWGVYSVPAFGSEWYPRNMHFEDSPVYAHHVATYGHPSEFGYHDFVPQFKAEHFDADAWTDLFQRAGARFAGPVAEHHDGFSMWDSDITPWNAADKGPMRDITGELATALRARGMKLITTFHHAKNLQRFDAEPGEGRTQGYRNSHYPFFEGMPPTSDDPELKYLYGNMPEDEWIETVWLGKIKEVVDNYQPDIIWFDSWLDQIPEARRREMAAYYLNRANERGQEVVIVRKQDDLPLDVSVDDLEKSRKNRLEEKSWMTDETISKGSWCYTEDLEIKEAKDVLHVLIDIASKNGVLLLNVSPKADGAIPADQQAVLEDIGAWLDAYGEAIYDTRPWYTFGEGPTKEPEGHFRNRQAFLALTYSWKDARYTTKGGTIYATLLGWPEESEIRLHAFAADSLAQPLTVDGVTLLGSDETIAWEQRDDGLVLQVPAEASNAWAPVFKIETR